ncbi:LysE/ArgO family amino acid transporter [Defluviimonas sp. WL0075]|uniref:LysE/ArgO family amino acid transporter n=1 Tax=Albidovulum sediminicola TaxID=2984331 RepID=A0ABT2Z257_9RHOB|nr:LysE/ArgO family amino acid transporter [Defluviimonas sp. WL0075]MCV2865211.1 LysE/ArgO family amino acid transporter [Defluviimonas sp. WL0075]
MQAPFIAGFQLGLGLILAIGAQNALVLRQGLRREHVFAVVLFCAVSDSLLIGIGVSSFGLARDATPWLGPALLWGGTCFLIAYGARAAWQAWRGGQALRVDGSSGAALLPTLATVAAMTWLNPHAWLDTVVFLGAVSAQYPGQGVAFGLGAAAASFLFFFTLGYGARLLQPLFARPGAWRLLDLLIALVMWSIAWRLATG